MLQYAQRLSQILLDKKTGLFLINPTTQDDAVGVSSMSGRPRPPGNVHALPVLLTAAHHLIRHHTSDIVQLLRVPTLLPLLTMDTIMLLIVEWLNHYPLPLSSHFDTLQQKSGIISNTLRNYKNIQVDSDLGQRLSFFSIGPVPASSKSFHLRIC